MPKRYEDVSVQLFCSHVVPVELVAWSEAVRLLGVELLLYHCDEGDSPAERNSAVFSWLATSRRGSLIQIDADILPPVDIGLLVGSLCDGVDVVGAPHPTAVGGNFAVAAAGLRGELDLNEGNGICECRWIGRGVIAFTRVTILRIIEELGCVYALETDSSGMKAESFDESFCSRLRRHGFSLWLDREFVCARSAGATIVALVGDILRTSPRGCLWNGRDFPSRACPPQPTLRLVAQALGAPNYATVMSSGAETVAAAELVDKLARSGFSVSLVLSDCSSSVTPMYLLALLDTLLESRPKRILDIGSGETTRLFNAYCETTGAVCDALEESAVFASYLRDLKNVRMRVHPVGDSGWYEGVAFTEPYDLVSVDGPRGIKRNRIAARIGEIAAGRSIVFVDDSGRPDVDALTKELCGAMGFMRTDLVGSRRFSVLRRG